MTASRPSTHSLTAALLAEERLERPSAPHLLALLRRMGLPEAPPVLAAHEPARRGALRAVRRLAGARARRGAHALGRAAVRAVGAANGSNPLLIVVPCHRVIGSDDSLKGFGGGLAAKAFLLNLESMVIRR